MIIVGQITTVLYCSVQPCDLRERIPCPLFYMGSTGMDVTLRSISKGRSGFRASTTKTTGLSVISRMAYVSRTVHRGTTRLAADTDSIICNTRHTEANKVDGPKVLIMISGSWFETAL